MYAQIIVPVDGGPFSARAVLPAARVARSCAAPLLIASFTSREAEVFDLEQAVAEAATSVDGPEVRTKVALVEDVPAAVAAEVEAVPGSLVCMTSIGRPRLAPVFGSVAEGILRRVTCPVLLFGPQADTAAFRLEGPLVVAVDGSETSEAILPIAASWGIAFGLDLRVVSVVAPGAVPTEAAEDVAPESAYVHHVARKLQDEVGRTVDFDVLHDDDAARGLLRDVETQRARVIAAATHGRGGLARVVAGSVTAALVHRASIPVLVYRPLQLEGFAH